MACRILCMIWILAIPNKAYRLLVLSCERSNLRRTHLILNILSVALLTYEDLDHIFTSILVRVI